MSTKKIIDAGPEGWVVFELPVTDVYSNLNGRPRRTSTIMHNDIDDDNENEY